VFSKNLWAYQFVSLAITSTLSGVQNSSHYSRGLLGPSESTFLPGLPVNEKCGQSAPEFAHTSGHMLLLSLTFSASSELTLCSPPDELFTFISLSLLYSLSEIPLYSFCHNFIKHFLITYMHLLASKVK
jgi:hypothetical protein